MSEEMNFIMQKDQLVTAYDRLGLGSNRLAQHPIKAEGEGTHWIISNTGLADVGVDCQIRTFLIPSSGVC